MKCPYDNKIDCTYLDEITANSRPYHCSGCPHYAPVPEADTYSIIKGIIFILAVIAFAFVIAQAIHLTH